MAASVHWAAQSDARPVSVRPLFADLPAGSHGTATKSARPSQTKGVLQAPDFVREAWARDAAERNHERQVADAFATRFVVAKAPAGAMTGEQLASLVKANQRAAEAKATQIAQAVPAATPASPAVAVASLAQSAPSKLAAAAAPDHEPEEEDVAEAATTVLASLETEDLPDLGLVPSWRPAIARKSVIAPVVPDRRGETVPALAYARPDNPIERPAAKSAAIPWPDMGRKTAIYDISNAVVHMPNGEKLEAHSGRGTMRDNPKFTHVKMRGATPPSTYRLTMRESRFHGVEAIRLNPVDGRAPQGRTGLLAHTYLLRVPGDSSGCVVFKNYARFLAAFKRGEVDRMIVVARLDDAPTARVASLFSMRRATR
jgi:hypothetical protein